MTHPHAPLRVGIIGCGKIADGHVSQIQRMPERARVVAACDLEPLMAEQLATRFDVESHYDSAEAMLASANLDVVHVATPPASHRALARLVLEQSCHLYLEKPVAPRIEDIEAIVSLAEAHDRKLAVGYTYLFDPPALAMRELIDQGVLGDPVHVESVYGYNLAGPFGSALMADPHHWVHRLPGRLMQNVLDHVINKLVEFFDDEIPTCTAFGKRLRPEWYGDERDALHDELRVMMDGRNVTAYATVSSHARPGRHACRVYGTENTMLVDYLARTVTLEQRAPLPTALGRLLTPVVSAGEMLNEGAKNMVRFARSDFHFFAGLYNLLDRFYGSILDDTPPPIPYADIRWVSRTVDDIIGQLDASSATRTRLEEVVA